MMVGGRIVSIREEDDRLCLIVADRPYGWHQYMGVDCEKTDHPMKLGDSLWWQCGNCYWTPEGEDSAWDVKIRKIGYSYSVGITRS